jgi:hypothetical protein
LLASACLENNEHLLRNRHPKLTNLLKNSRDMGSKPASWIEVKPLATALSTVMAKRLSRSASVRAGFLINSWALSMKTP